MRVGRNLPTGGRIDAELGIGHVETELNIPEKIAPLLQPASGTAAATTMNPIDNGTEVDRYTQIQTTARITRSRSAAARIQIVKSSGRIHRSNDHDVRGSTCHRRRHARCTEQGHTTKGHGQ